MTRAPNVRTGKERRRNRDGEPVRDRIFRVSSALFAKKGFDATGIQELSEAIGLGRGALYYHIKSKNDLLFEICSTLLDEAIEEAEQIAAKDEPVEQRIRALARALVVNLAERRDAWTVSLSELRALPSDSRDKIIERRRRYELVWSRLFAEGADTGVFRPVDDVLLRGILGFLNSTYLWIKAQPRSPELVADAYIDLIFDGLRQQ